MDRYNRHLILDKPKITLKDLDKQIIIIGCGGIGSNFAYLATTLGIKNIHLIDRDVIDISNLNRQALFFEKDVSKSKSKVLCSNLKKINSDINITYDCDQIDELNIDKKIKKITNKKQNKSNIIIIDCTDNLFTRLLVNDYCTSSKLNYISSATIKTTGYVYSYISDLDNACINCFLRNKKSETSCGLDGVLNGSLYMCASIILSELIKIIKKEYSIKNKPKLIKFDSYNYDINQYSIKKDNNCTICKNKEFNYLNKNEKNAVEYCSGYYQKQIESKAAQEIIKKLKLLNKKKKIKNFKNIEIGCKLEKITIFTNGRIITKAKSKKEAERLFNDYVN